MHIWKSLLIIVFMLLILLGCLWLSFCSIQIFRKQRKWRTLCLGTMVSCVCIILMYCFLWDYVYPFDRALEFKLTAELEIPPSRTMLSPPNLNWHAAYEQYGLYAGSTYFDIDEKTSYLGFDWPEMDFQHYTYIITYGQKLESLSYNVWETIDVPIRTGAKVGHATLSDQFDSNKVYIYQIKKMRIDNDP